MKDSAATLAWGLTASAAILAFVGISAGASAEAEEVVDPLTDFETRLGDPDWSVREKASLELARGGELLLPVMFRLLSSQDPEVRSRAGSVLRSQPESNILVREAFQAGEAGVSWIFGRIRGKKAQAGRRGVDAENLVMLTGYYGGPESVEPLADRVARGDNQAARALSLLGCRKEAYQGLQRRLKPGSDRTALLAAMGLVGNPAARPFLERTVSEGDEMDRRGAQAGLEHLAWADRAERMAAVLLGGNLTARREAKRWLESASGAFRERVADSLLRSPGADPAALLDALDGDWVRDAVPAALFGFRRGRALLPALTRALQTRTAGSLQFWALTVLAEFPSEGGARALADCLYVEALSRRALRALRLCGESACPAIAEAALQKGAFPRGPEGVSPEGHTVRGLFLKSPGRTVFDTLGRLVLSPQPGVAAYAAGILADRGSEAAVQALLRGARQGGARKACVRGLGKLGREAGFERLASLLSANPPGELIEGLGRSGDARAGPLLVEALTDRRLAPCALRGLGWLGDLRYLPVLGGALFDDRCWRNAIEGLEILGGDEALNVLQSFERSARILGYVPRALAANTAIYRMNSGQGRND